ncbi:MAG: lipoyl domain-containing protein [Candidatus Bathyarchaeia archaeon]
MQEYLLMPNYPGFEEVTVAKWHKEPGASFAKFEPLVVVETEKVAMEIQAPKEGRIVQVIASKGTRVRSGQPIALISEN